MKADLNHHRHVDDAAIQLLGGLLVRAADSTQTLDVRTNGGLVLAYLATRCNERVPASDLAALIWPTDRPATYRKGVQVAVLRVREAFDPQRTRRVGGVSPIVSHPDGYELRCPLEWIDAARFELLVRSGQRALAEGAATIGFDCLTRALNLWGDPFGGADVPALRDYVERLYLTRGAALTALREAEVQLGREDLSDLERAVQDDPFDERRWGHLMIGCFRRGRQVEALAVFQRARRFLVDEVGVEPGPYLRKIEEQVLLQEGPALAVAAVPTLRATAVAWPPVPPATELLLRDDELRAVESQLERWRIVSIVGPPGVGKTTLATALAEKRPPQAVAWASLSAVQPGPGAIIDLARLLGVASEASSDPDEFATLLTGRIGDHPLLVVLDNAEHLIDRLAQFVELLVRSCPNVTVLLTSRRPLGCRSERVAPLAPFEVEPGRSRAITYLAERAGVPFDDGPSGQALARIAARVGGLALGLEQAAGWLRALTPEELADRLDLLDDSSSVDGLSRAIDWSLSLLKTDEVMLLKALAHLEAPWNLSRADAVGAQFGLDSHAVSGAVASLHDHSLITLLDPRRSSSRRRIIEPVRLHLRALAAAEGLRDRCSRASAHAVLTETVDACRQVEGADQRAGIARLDSLMPDIRQSIAWGVEAGDCRLVATMLAQLRSWWWTSGLYADGQTLHAYADPVVSAWAPTAPADAHLRLRALAAGVGTRPGFAAPAIRVDDLARWLAEADRLDAPAADRSWITQLLSAGLTFINRDMDAAAEYAQLAVRLANEARSPWLVGWATYASAIARGRAAPVEALSLLEQAVAAFVSAGDRLNAARVMMFLGHGVRIFGDPRGSDDAFAQAETWCKDVGAAPVTQLDCALGRAQSTHATGDWRQAAAMYRSLIPRLWELGDYRCAAVAQRCLGSILFRDGDLQGASALAVRALGTLRSLDGEDTEVAAALLLRAEIAVANGHDRFAARLVGRAGALAAGGGVPMDLSDLNRLDEVGRTLTSTLGSEVFAELQASGSSDSLL